MNGSEFRDNFDSDFYSSQIYPNRPNPQIYSQFLLRQIIKFCQDKKLSPNSLRVLDYGSGPAPVLAMGFSSIAREIVLAEYEEGHRDYIKKWLSNSPGCHDWSFNVKYIAELEGTPHESELSERAMKEKMAAVVQCDITVDSFISEGYEGPYDIVLSSLCMENACKSIEDYRAAMKKLVSLVNKEGYLFLFSTIRENSEVGFYTVNNKRLYNFAVKEVLS